MHMHNAGTESTGCRKHTHVNGVTDSLQYIVGHRDRSILEMDKEAGNVKYGSYCLQQMRLLASYNKIPTKR